MNPIDYIRKQIFAQAIARGVRDDIAKRHADMAAIQYLENRYQSPSDLVETSVKNAVKHNVK